MASDLDEKETDLSDQDDALAAEIVDDETEPFDDYRSLSGMAVLALIIGVVSPLAFVAPVMLLLPMVGMVLGVLAVLQTWARDLHYHPHVQARHVAGANNTLYLAADRLSMGPDLPGWGVLNDHRSLRLTRPGSARISDWCLDTACRRPASQS